TGFAALLLGLLLADWFFIPPKSVLGTSNFLEVFRIVRYLFTASVGIALIEILHRGRRRTQAAVDELEREVSRRQRSENALLEAQAQLSKHAAELEQRVAERTAKLAATIRSLEA